MARFQNSSRMAAKLKRSGQLLLLSVSGPLEANAVDVFGYLKRTKSGKHYVVTTTI